MSKILVRVPNWIGDAILALPAIEALARLYPKSEITVLAKPKVAPVFKDNPHVADIYSYESEGRHGGVNGRIKLAGELKKLGFDMAVLFQNAFEAALIAFLAGIPRRIGYARDMRSIFLTHSIKPDKALKKRHQVYYYLNIVQKLGGRVVSGGVKPIPKLYISDEEYGWAGGFLKKQGLGAGVHIVGAAPGASYGPAKRWSVSSFGEALDTISKELKAVPVIFGAGEDDKIAQEVSSCLSVRHLNFVGKLSLREFMAVLSRVSVFISNDSGPMHIAASVGTPTVAIFGSTDPVLTGPVGKNVCVIYQGEGCGPCFERVCPKGHYKCLTSINADAVADEAVKIAGATGW